MMTLYDRTLTIVRPLDTALREGVEENLNDLNNAELTMAVHDPVCSRIDVPASFARIWDGGIDKGYYRFEAIEREEHSERGEVTYRLQSAECTLLDSMLDGWHAIGGTGVNTRTVINYILGHQAADKTGTQRWMLGDCEFEDFYEYNFEDVTLLEAIMSLGEVLLEPYEFVFDSTAVPWTMHLRRRSEQPTRVLLYGRNMTSLRRSVSGLPVTRLYGRGYGEGDNQLTIASVNGGRDYLDADADAVARWGIREGVHVDTRQTDPATLKAHMQQILAGCSHPSIAYEAEVIDLYRLTGESWDDVREGEKVLVVDELLGMAVTVDVTRRKKPDIEGDPGAISLLLESRIADTAEEINEIRERIGVRELYSQGATNMYSMQISDNCDAEHPLVMRFYVPGNVLRINSCLLTWRLERFRTYATLAMSSSGGGATVSTPATTVTEAASTEGPLGGDGVSGVYTEAGGGHAITPGEETITIPDHTHRHSHWHHVTATVRIPPMQFTIGSHSHSVSIREHTHALEYGVYEQRGANTVSLIVDGEEVPPQAIGEENELDVTAFLRKDDDGKVRRSSWHQVEFIPDGLTRITSDLFFQVFIQSRGGGDY